MRNFRLRCGVDAARALILAVLLSCPPPVWAVNRALLVGVGVYDNLPENRQLRGPANDAALMRDLLLDQGFAEPDIELLADGLPRAQPPTRRAIDNALARLAVTAGSGDFVFVHFSGHGSQQPARSNGSDSTRAEPDGLDETILPRDVGRWDGAARTVGGALTDDEIMAALTRIRDRGAFVWAVFDSCHSGDITRGAPVDTEERERRVAPAELGIPASELSNNARSEAQARGVPGDESIAMGSRGLPAFVLPAGGGGMITFSASQSGETTPEFRLPLAEPLRRPQGLFTFTLAQVIGQFPRLTYRQLMAQVQHRYVAMGRDRPTPALGGEEVDLDRTIFGGASNQVAGQWRIENRQGQLTVEAGALQEVALGSILGIIAQPVDTDARTLGFARVVDAGMVRSRLEPIAYSGLGKLRGADLPSPVYGRLVLKQMPVRLPVSLPCDAGTGIQGEPQPAQAPCATTNPVVRKALELLRLELSLSVDIHQAGSSEAVVRLAVWDRRLWLLTASGDLDLRNSPAIRLDRGPGEIAVLLGNSLRQIARVRNLERIAANSRPGASGLTVDFSVKREGSPEWHQGISGQTAATKSGDRLRFGLLNKGREAIDVTMLFVDARWGIRVAYPPPGTMVSNRLPALSTQPVQVTATVRTDGTDSTAGVERMLIIAVPAKPQTPEADFGYLAQATLPTERGMTATAWSRLLERAVFVPRNDQGFAMPVATAAGPELGVITWRTLRK